MGWESDINIAAILVATGHTLSDLNAFEDIEAAMYWVEVLKKIAKEKQKIAEKSTPKK